MKLSTKYCSYCYQCVDTQIENEKQPTNADSKKQTRTNGRRRDMNKIKLTFKSKNGQQKTCSTVIVMIC